MSNNDCKTFFDQWLTQYVDRLDQVCHGVRETMRLQYAEVSASLSSPELAPADSCGSNTRPVQ